MSANKKIDWAALHLRHSFLEKELACMGFDNAQKIPLQKEYGQLSNVLTVYEALQQIDRDREVAENQLKDLHDPEYVALYNDELVDLRQMHDQKKRELDELVAPPDILDDRSVYVEVRAGTGGQEAALFAGDLARMYTQYALKKGWRASVQSESSTDLGGFREVVLHIQGKGVYGFLKKESGVHRVQRVPSTETQGRVHTSTATVAVLPEAEDVDAVTVNPADLRIDVYRASGAGGQHVNTTDSAVRITHIPSGLVVTCQDERSQHKNKAKALKMLQSRLLVAQLAAQEAEKSKQRKELVGTGDRAEKVRTYNFPQNRVSDHQANCTVQKLDMVMMGDLDDIIDALREQDRVNRAEKFLSQYL